MLSRKTPNLGIREHKLRPCPNKPNCVCSEHYDHGNRNHIEAITYHGIEADIAWKILTAIIKTQGGILKQNSENYLWAHFVTRFWHFTDDFEARLDKDQEIIHIRCASRVGYSDFGTNARRVEHIKSAFRTELKTLSGAD